MAGRRPEWPWSADDEMVVRRLIKSKSKKPLAVDVMLG
jgi:hypothetical protein